MTPGCWAREGAGERGRKAGVLRGYVVNERTVTRVPFGSALIMGLTSE